ncbi:MAG: hypothetical protein IPN90_07915 [Elusimicrobia bacterium]|nr:hypothetical protein [Elusimicrobiota bacterium]
MTPRMTKVPDNARPLDVFARAPLPLEKLLAGDVIHLAYAHLTEGRGETLSAVPEGPVRQTTLQLGWVAIRNVLESELNKNADSVIVCAFRGLTHISKKSLVFQAPLSGFLFKAAVVGNEKQFKVVMAPKNEADVLYEKNGLDESPSLKIDLTVDTKTYEVRVYDAEENKEVEWVSAGYTRLGRYLARSLAALNSVRSLKPAREFWNERLTSALSVVKVKSLLKKLPFLENTRFGRPGSVRSPLVWALTAWTLAVAAIISFSLFWGLSFAALLTAWHFSANFERGPPKWNLVWEGQSFKSLWRGLLFVLSFGLIPDGRAENSVEPDPLRMIAPSSETTVEGLVSFSSNPDAEQAAAGLSEKVRSSLLEIQRGQDLRDGVNNIGASLQDALPLGSERAGELSQLVLSSSVSDPWLNSFAELIRLKSGERSEDPAQALKKLLSVAHSLFEGPRRPGEREGVSDHDVWVHVLDVFKDHQGGATTQQKTDGLIDLHSLATQQSSERNSPLFIVLLSNRIENDWLSETYAKALISDPHTPDWLRLIADKKANPAGGAQERVDAGEEMPPRSPVYDYLNNINSPPDEKDILWDLVRDWAREVLLGTTGTLEGRVLNLSPLEAYVLLAVMSRQDPTLPMIPATAAQVRTQLWVNILSELKMEFDRGPLVGTSIYGPLSSLIFHGEEFGQQAFYQYAKETDQLDALYKIVPGSLKPFLDNQVQNNLSPASKIGDGAPSINRALCV